MTFTVWSSINPRVTGGPISPVRDPRPEKLATQLRPTKVEEHTDTLLHKDPASLGTEALDLELAQELNIAPGVPIPNNWAILHVSEPRRDHLKLYGIYRSMVNRKIPEFQQQKIGLAEFIESKVHPKNIFERVNRFSRELVPQELQLWLRNVIRRSPEAVLIIVEHTETCIPWELVRLEKDYLGALTEVVRWTTIRYYHRSVCILPQEELQFGSVASFVDPHSAKDMSSENAELRELCHRELKDRDEFLDFLENDLSSVGLIYLGCHGVLRYGDKNSPLYRTLGSLENPSEAFVDLDLEDLERRGERLPVFVVNACHSGRLHRDEGGELHGFPRVFLAYVASAYVGTLGPVGNPFASEMGARILRRIRECSDGIYLSRFLREMRKEASRGISYRKSPLEDQLRMLYTFMYVYYGNPLLRLRTPRPEQV